MPMSMTVAAVTMSVVVITMPMPVTAVMIEAPIIPVMAVTMAVAVIREAIFIPAIAVAPAIAPAVEIAAGPAIPVGFDHIALRSRAASGAATDPGLTTEADARFASSERPATAETANACVSLILAPPSTGKLHTRSALVLKSAASATRKLS